MIMDRKSDSIQELETEETKKDGNCEAGAVLIVCLMTLPLLVILLGGRLSSKMIWRPDMIVTTGKGLSYNLSQASVPSGTKNLDGLISTNFDKISCLSRFEASLYRNVSPFVPSSYLLQKLRKYETLHMKCGPNTPLYKKSIQSLNSSQSNEHMDCNYIVWIPYAGLGNRMLSLTSIFLYALLTNRVLLIQQTEELVDLFCEPFPNTTWILPSDFPIKNLNQLNIFSRKSYGNMLNKHAINNNPKTKVPPYVYIHLNHDFNHLDGLFFCHEDQIVLGKVNWLLLQSNLYFVPPLFSVPLFEHELGLLFPAKDSIFNLLARYLMHPSNSVWGMVTRFYLSYLYKAKKRIGMQVRIFPWCKTSSDRIFAQILHCSRLENVLPEIELNGAIPHETKEVKSKAILVTSLREDYYEKLKSMYYEHWTKTGEFVSVHQPSYEGKQQSEKQSHNKKALAEIYLLSLCDVLMTSELSTFGYVSYGLAGIKPVVLRAFWGGKEPNPACARAVTLEPCHLSPSKSKIKCRGKMADNVNLQEPYVCEGVKMSRG